MDYISATNYINEKNKLGMVPGLFSIKELLRRLDNPEDKCKCIHIAGTNGKGSVFAFTEAILKEANFKVGRYISPTIFTYLERFQIGGSYMCEEEFAGIMTIVANKVDEMIKEGLDSPTAFEIETAVAFVYFAKNEVDFVLLETGMGGRLDSTNVLKENVMSVITTIGMDHMKFLGETLIDITAEKLGIVKPNSICITSSQKDEVKEYMKKYIDSINTKLIEANIEEVIKEEMSLDGSRFTYKEDTYEISLLGEHQISNAITAIEIATNINGVSKANIVNGLRKTKWLGRLTKVSENPEFYVDGAHNFDGWNELKKVVNKYFTNNEIIYIMGVLEDKEYHKMVDILRDTMSYAITVTPDNIRALDGEILADLIIKEGIEARAANNLHEAKKLACEKVLALEQAGKECTIIACGSLSFIATYIHNDELEKGAIMC